jgi:hypothetical protein
MAIRALALAVVIAASLAPAAAPQTPQAQPLGSGYLAPRTSDGRPDLQGVWSNASLTNLSRPPNVSKLEVTKAEADELVRTNPWILLAQSEAGPSDFNDNLLEDGNSDRGYNTFWIDPGQSLATVNGTIRTSWIVEPADGRLPVSDLGRTKQRERSAALRAVPFAGPETLPIAERCLIGFTGAGGPGMLNTIYNNNYQIVQAPDHVMILVEMVHDARIIPIVADKTAARHKPDVIKPWLGDSVGWYEGDELIVETRNVHPQQSLSGQIILSEQGVVTERFRRIADDQIFYQFAVTDPLYYTSPWRAEMSLNRRDEAIYEYACHEGNYAMEGILGGARKLEARGEKPTFGPGIFGTPIPTKTR